MTQVTPLPKKKRRKKSDRQKMIAKCDTLFSLQVRKVGHCESGRSARHGGILQCAHGFSRRYHAVRWEGWNGFCFCAACHVYFTHRPLEWECWLQELWGVDVYWERRAVAMAGIEPDLNALHEQLKVAA